MGDAAPQGAHDVLADHQAIAAVTGGGFDGFAQDGVALPQHQEVLLHRRRKLHGLAGGAVLDDVGAYVVDQAHQQGDVGPHAEGPAGPVGVVQAEAVAGEEIVDAGGHLGQQFLAVVGIQRQGPAVLLEGEQVVGQTADVVGFFQGPVDEQRGALRAAGIALGQQLQIADVYDAMTSKRCYRDGMCPFDVIEDFEYDGISKYHPKYIGMFLKKIASSYIGSTVLLTNGKKAKIIFVTEKYSRPTVTLLEDNSVLVLKDEKDIKIAAVL